MPNSPVFINGSDVAQANQLGQVHVQGLPRGSAANVVVHDGLTERAESVTREREILAVPRFLYAVGERFRKQEHSYRLIVAQTGRPVSPGISLYDAAGEVIEVTGYDGVATITGVAGEFEFEEGEEICAGAFTGVEAGENAATLVVSCP